MKSFQRWLAESAKEKAGGFPYYKKDGKVYVCLFKSNNAYYGGSRPQMPKGHIDKGEDAKTASAREVYEETGVPLSALRNGKHVTSDTFNGEVSTYTQHVYAFYVKRYYKPVVNNEGNGEWYEMDDGINKIRRDQRVFLEKLKSKIGA